MEICDNKLKGSQNNYCSFRRRDAVLHNVKNDMLAFGGLCADVSTGGQMSTSADPG